MKNGPERELVDRYRTRAAQTGKPLGFAGCDVIEVAESRASSADRRKLEEAQGLRAKLPDGAVAVALDERGTLADSRKLAHRIAQGRDDGRSAFALVIGGADGLHESLTGDAVAFGRFVIPHQIVRVLVAEQLYRATTILAGHPYHRD